MHYVVLKDAIDRIVELEEAIRTHRSQRADDRCIEDDDKLYSVLGDGVTCDRDVGCPMAMAMNCMRFIRNRTTNEGKWISYAELELLLEEASQEIVGLNERISDLIRENSALHHQKFKENQ